MKLYDDDDNDDLVMLLYLFQMANVYKALVHDAWPSTNEDELLSHYTNYIKVLLKIQVQYVHFYYIINVKGS